MESTSAVVCSDDKSIIHGNTEWPRYSKSIKDGRGRDKDEGTLSWVFGAMFCHNISNGTQRSLYWSVTGYVQIFFTTSLVVLYSPWYASNMVPSGLETDWIKPWSYMQQACGYFWYYLICSIPVIVLSPTLCGNDVNESRGWLLVGSCWQTVNVTLLVLIASEDYDKFMITMSSTESYIWWIAFVSCCVSFGFIIFCILRSTGVVTTQDQLAVKKDEYEEYVRELLNPRSDEETQAAEVTTTTTTTTTTTNKQNLLETPTSVKTPKTE